VIGDMPMLLGKASKVEAEKIIFELHIVHKM
jgi:hypothetical protein